MNRAPTRAARRRPVTRGPAPHRGEGEYLYGVHAVATAVESGQPVHEVHVLRERSRDDVVRRILALARERGIPAHLDDATFFKRFPYKAHQGVVALVEPFAYAQLHDVLRKRRSPSLFVVLDHVTDPHNLGAIVRTAECAGADAVVIPERRAAGMTPAARKVAAGAAERLPVVRVVNVRESLRVLKKAGLWIVGADASAPARSLYETDLDGDLAVVVGAEGEGLSALVRRECDLLVRIPLYGTTPSLNASVAAGIILYEIRRRTGPRP